MVVPRVPSSILMVFSIINHPFGGTPIYGNPHISQFDSWWKTSVGPRTGPTAVAWTRADEYST
jgi:hypothetical protein